MEGADDVFGALLAQRTHRLHAFVHIGLEVVVIAVDAEREPAVYGKQLTLALLAVGDAVFLQRGIGAFNALLAEVLHVVVGGGHEIHAALDKDVGIGRRREEIPLFGGVQLAVGEGALQIGDREIVGFEILHGVGIGVGVVLAHAPRVGDGRAGKLVRGEGVVADDGDEVVAFFERGLLHRRGIGPGIGFLSCLRLLRSRLREQALLRIKARGGGILGQRTLTEGQRQPQQREGEKKNDGPASHMLHLPTSPQPQLEYQLE